MDPVWEGVWTESCASGTAVGNGFDGEGLGRTPFVGVAVAGRGGGGGGDAKEDDAKGLGVVVWDGREASREGMGEGDRWEGRREWWGLWPERDDHDAEERRLASRDFRGRGKGPGSTGLSVVSASSCTGDVVGTRFWCFRNTNPATVAFFIFFWLVVWWWWWWGGVVSSCVVPLSSTAAWAAR